MIALTRSMLPWRAAVMIIAVALQSFLLHWFFHVVLFHDGIG